MVQAGATPLPSPSFREHTMVFSARSVTTAFAFGALLATLPAGALGAQTVRTSAAGASDSVAWVVRRQPLDAAQAILRTRKRDVAVLLTDTTVVLQFTNSGLDQVARSLESDPPKNVGGTIIANMLSAGIVSLLDHGIVYRLSGLREARVD